LSEADRHLNHGGNAVTAIGVYRNLGVLLARRKVQGVEVERRLPFRGRDLRQCGFIALSAYCEPLYVRRCDDRTRPDRSALTLARTVRICEEMLRATLRGFAVRIFIVSAGALVGGADEGGAVSRLLMSAFICVMSSGTARMSKLILLAADICEFGKIERSRGMIAAGLRVCSATTSTVGSEGFLTSIP